MKSFLRILFLFVVILSGKQFLSGQNRRIDSLLVLLKTDKEDTNKVNHLNRLCDSYRRAGEHEKALNFGRQSAELGKKINFKKGIAGSYFNVGVVYRNQGKYPEALKNYLASLKIREETGDKYGISSALNSIGTVYYMQGNYAEALKTYQAGLKILEVIGDKNGIAATYGNMGGVYLEQGNYTEALKIQLAAIKIQEETGDKNGMANLLNNIGAIYSAIGNVEEALKNYLACLRLKEELKDNYGIAFASANIGALKTGLRKYDEAKRYLGESLSLAKEIGANDVIRNAHLSFSELDSVLGNYKSSLEHYKLYIVYRDSLLNEESTKKTIQSQMQYEFDKKSSADSIKNSEAKKFEEIKYQQEISKQKTFTYGGVIGFLVMIIVAGISFAAFRNKKKANIEIARQKHLVEEKQKEILDSIYYARRIQHALLTSEFYINRILKKISG